MPARRGGAIAHTNMLPLAVSWPSSPVRSGVNGPVTAGKFARSAAPLSWEPLPTREVRACIGRVGEAARSMSSEKSVIACALTLMIVLITFLMTMRAMMMKMNGNPEIITTRDWRNGTTFSPFFNVGSRRVQEDVPFGVRNRGQTLFVVTPPPRIILRIASAAPSTAGSALRRPSSRCSLPLAEPWAFLVSYGGLQLMVLMVIPMLVLSLISAAFSRQAGACRPLGLPWSDTAGAAAFWRSWWRSSVLVLGLRQ